MSRRPSPTAASSRRAIALKRADGEPLTRADIQYQVLFNIFHDDHNVFTDPYPTNGAPPGKICFNDLYLKTIMHSPKATKILKDKIIDSHLFAEDFSMLALLVNVGRVNTTMSFFPEMKTTIRTYHPIPALQRTTGNLQDAPRIKHILKSSLLENEQTPSPSTPADILARVKAGHVPSTTIMNLVFVLASHSAPIGRVHWSEDLDFIDIFLRGDVSSHSRARAFLWLCYNYLEDSSTGNHGSCDGDISPNPFADRGRGNTPTFVFLSEAEMAQENADPEDEKALAEKLIVQRAEILRNQSTKRLSMLDQDSIAGSVIVDADSIAVSGDEVKPKVKRAPAKSKVFRERKAAAERLRRSRLRERAKALLNAPVPTPGADEDHALESLPATIVPPIQNQYPQSQFQYQPQLQPEAPIIPQVQPRISGKTSESSNVHQHRHRYSPYGSPISTAANLPKHTHKLHRSQIPSVPHRTMLQHAWDVVTNTDPLLDSDDELGDEHVRYDYIQRLRVISRLRRQEPTPEPERLTNVGYLTDRFEQ